MAERLRDTGVEMYFSSLKHQVMKVLDAAGVVQEMGRDKFFSDKETALEALCAKFDACASEPAAGAKPANA